MLNAFCVEKHIETMIFNIFNSYLAVIMRGEETCW